MKRFLTYTFYLCVFSIMMGCNNNIRTGTVKLDSPDTLTKAICIPTILEYDKGKILIVDMFAKYNMISILNATNGKELATFGRKGEGKGDFGDIASGDFINEKGNSRLILFDLTNRQILEFNLEDVLKHKYKHTTKEIKSNERIFEMHKICNNYIASGLMPKGKYAILDSSLNIISYQGEYMTNKSKDTDKTKNIKANYGKISVCDDEKHFVEIVYMASTLNFYKVDKGDITLLSSYVIKPLDYKVKEGKVINNQVEGFVSAAYSKKHVYALYSGKRKTDEIATYGKEVYVFSYNGDFEKRLILRSPASQICVDEEDNKLYALILEPEPCILCYELQNPHQVS